MTTQHTHHENSDVDAFVAEHPSVPEDTIASTPAETTVAVEVEAQANSSSSEFALPLAGPETRQESVEEHRTEDQDKSLPEAPTSADETPSVPSEAEPAATATEEQPVSSIPEAPGAEAEKDIRPFTAFIEEFRQVEARINASVKESEKEVFRFSSPTETDMVALNSWGVPDTIGLPDAPATVVETPLERVVNEITSVEPVFEPASSTPEEPEAASTPKAQVERAPSPLLRPTTRLRSSRHTRHRGEHSAETAEPASKPTQGAEAAEKESAQSVQAEPAATEATTVETETPRPARRYRFDRPAATNGAAAAATTSSQASRSRVEESREKAANTQTPDAEAQAVESKKAAQEPASTESPVAPVEQHSRRRGHTKDQQAGLNHTIASAPETPLPVAEVAPQPPEIAPEDLPPLEYSELQKASSRRRRRHRSGASNNGTAAAAMPPVSPAPVTPSVPEFPGPASNSYSIVSGYTVNQMNQGNEQKGPFMGPEPSPARGSILSRESRAVRAEAQRSISPAQFPGRSTEPSLPSSTSINHLANTITQALQVQTDRMVAELRRALQAPTNVSVSLPAFPSTERVGVFVDVANLLYSARTLRLSIDFGKLLDFLRGNRRLVRAQAYCPTSPQPGDEQMFLQAVKGLGYRITTKNYKTFSSGAKKADLDLDLCMDVVRLVEGRAVDCIVLVSGDSDFMPMLDYCSDHGVRVEVAAFDEAMSATLRQGCDLFVNLSMLEEIRADIR
ncbi:MAG TPA: NYN domain-containing protein [Ktedonobacteraceae bacterium]|nr:NYN domain-containing protein [Ktedonobacteraceae bacterium]